MLATVIMSLIKRFRKISNSGSINFKTAFVIVLLLHVTVYCGLSIWSSRKPNLVQATGVTRFKSEDAVAPKEVWPTDNMVPKIIAKPKPSVPPSVNPVTETKKDLLTASTNSAKSYTSLTINQAVKSFDNLSKEVIRVTTNLGAKNEVTHDKNVVSRPSITPSNESREADRRASSPLYVVSSNTSLNIASRNSTSKISENRIRSTKPKKTDRISQELDKTLAQLSQDISNDLSHERRYTIQPGENLYIIAHKMQTSYHSIMVANNIKDPRDLRVGQILKIPHKRDI